MTACLVRGKHASRLGQSAQRGGVLADLVSAVRMDSHEFQLGIIDVARNASDIARRSLDHSLFHAASVSIANRQRESSVIAARVAGIPVIQAMAAC